MEEESVDIYLRWLNNELTSVELESLEKSGDLAILEAIKLEIGTWELPEPQHSYENLRTLLSNKRSKKAKIIVLFKQIRVAASLMLLASLSIICYYIFLRTVSFETKMGETQTLVMPDNSIITLQENSSIAYNPYDWEEDRIINMTGVVLFDVRRKGDFMVNFDGGDVEVKGTVFEVIANKDIKSVKCFEGKVAVNFSKNSHVLLPGNGVSSDNKRFDFKVEELLEAEYSNFENAKLSEVLMALSHKFGYSFNTSVDLSNKYFTGRFDNTNGEKALMMVFNPIAISFTVSDKQVTLK